MKFTIENHIHQIPIALEKIHSFAGKYTSNKEDLQIIKLVMDEALSNIIKYAYKEDGVKLIVIKTSLQENCLTIQITDNGYPFNPLTEYNSKPISDMKSIEEGGLGIHLMKNLVDELQYQRIENKNELSIKKTISKF
jgi:serine/threonine-protein kinase RsbW/sigma-B regulation protein RsbU (phosphoserine phosphatase)